MAKKSEVNKNPDEFLWTESYRPQTLDECILPESQLKFFRAMVKKQEIQNLMLCGSAGVGKTTVARALCNELQCDYLMINASEENGIDVLRTKIRQFASSVSFAGGIKVVILDEADHLGTNVQAAFRAFIEEFSANCRFIFTCNYKNRIIPALHSRTTVVEFKLTKEDKPAMAASFFKRVKHILDAEQITYSDKVVAALVQKYFPDNRRTLNELQRYSASGSIDEGILGSVSDLNTKALVKSMQDKDWKMMRQWVSDNGDQDPATLYRLIYDTLSQETDDLPQLVLLVADYGYKVHLCADPQINLAALLTECMGNLTWK